MKQKNDSDKIIYRYYIVDRVYKTVDRVDKKGSMSKYNPRKKYFYVQDKQGCIELYGVSRIGKMGGVSYKIGCNDIKYKRGSIKLKLTTKRYNYHFARTYYIFKPIYKK